MQHKKKIFYTIVIVIIITMIVAITISINENLRKTESEAILNEELKSEISFEIYSNSLDSSSLIALVTCVDSIEGIREVNLPNSQKIEGYGKNKIAIDYVIHENGIYNFELISKNGNKIQKQLEINDEFRSKLLKFNFDNENEITTNITATIICEDIMNMDNIYYKLGENNKWIKYDNGNIELSSYDLLKFKNEDNTINLYAKTEDTARNIVITKTVVSKLDLDIANKPVIKSDMEYPIITSTGIGLIGGNIVIDFDSRQDITNYYSLDNINWFKYSGKIKIEGTPVVYAKSVKNNSGLEVTTSKMVSGNASDAINPLTYDGDLNTYVSANGKNKIDVDESMWGKTITIKWKRSGYDFAGDGRYSAYMRAYDAFNKQLGDTVRSNEYVIPENTKYLIFFGTSVGKIFELGLKIE